MTARTRSKDHSRHVTDERFNTASHLVAMMFSLLGGTWLIVQASLHATPWHIVGASVYAASLVLLFLASTLHHGLNGSERLEEVLRTLDYEGIFLLIGGTMTPICIAMLGTPLAWTVFGVAWALCVLGMVLRAIRPDLPKWLTSTFYGALGALGVALVWPIYEATGLLGVALLAVGGAAYSFGNLIYASERPNPVPGRFGFHEIWHLFVMAGAAAHFAFMALFLVPAG